MKRGQKRGERQTMINKMAIDREPFCDVLALSKASSLNPLIAKIADRGH
jgi:hypothetical protein